MARNSSTVTQYKGYDHLFNLILIGDSRVGKSNLLSRFTRDDFLSESQSTIGMDFATRTINVDNKILKAQVWDIAGPKRFQSIYKSYYRGAAGSMLIYDISKRDTFKNIDVWLCELREDASVDICIMLVGNKSDLNHSRAVSQEEATAYARQHSMLYWEVSAKTSENVEEAFANLIAYINRFN